MGASQPQGLILQGIEIDVQHVGRSDWLSGVDNTTPWSTSRILPDHELWFFWRGL